MTPTGPRSRTDVRALHGFASLRPGLVLGRLRTSLLCLLVLGSAAPALASSSGDLFSWWRRQLLPISFEEGGWVTLARQETAEGQVVSDTLTCRVLASTDEASTWIQVESSGDPERWVLQVDLAKLRATDEPIAAVLGVFRVAPGGPAVREDLSELKENSFARRSLEDMFTSPEIVQTDLPDSLVSGAAIRRQAVQLSETQETTLPMGDRRMIHSTELFSRATLSPDVPVVGLLESFTRTVSATRWEGNLRGSRPTQPPLISQTHTRCLAFGREPARPRPPGVDR